jgi:4-amino-4-deoxy-L-arabinose transferase-like glycosyltransferase
MTWNDNRSCVAAVVLWLVAGVLLFAFLGVQAIERSQEARVAETAREMLGQGWRGWLIPHCNGRVRLHKPPLAYWAAAGAFKVFGVHDWAARVPMALTGWLTLGLTYSICRRLANRRTGLLAAGTLFTTLFFYKYARLAETDVLTMFFVTAAIAGLLRARAADNRRHAFIWHHVMAAAMGMAVLSKGPPALFVLAFFVGLAWISGRWRMLLEWVVCGAPLTLAIIALPWWIYVARTPEFRVVKEELDVVLTGADHPEPFWFYIPVILKATLPWCGFVVLGLVAAGMRIRRSGRVRLLLMWPMAILLPLSLVPQKQEHYLLPALPGLMGVVGWVLDRALRGVEPALRRVAGWILGGTVVGLLAAAVIVALRLWEPWGRGMNYREVAYDIGRDFGGESLVLYKDETLPLCFYMRRIIPFYATREELTAALRGKPGTLVICEEKGNEKSPLGVEVGRFDMGKRRVVLYRVSSSSAQAKG